MFLKFDVATEGREREEVLIAVSEIASVHQYEGRHSYGGGFQASEISLKNGKTYKVYGHVEKTVREACQVEK